MPQPMTSSANVVTDRPARYGKQLVAHLRHRSPGTWDDATASGEIRFEQGTATLRADRSSLVLSLTAAADSIDRLEDVLGRHLVRFATKDPLDVAWRRDDGSQGSHQSSATPSSPIS